MPSRKRTKGKERKAKKGAFRRTWQRWALGEGDNKKVVHCDHGLNVTIPDDDHLISKFIDSLFIVGDMENTIQIYPKLFKNDSDRSLTINLLVSIAVTNLLCPNDGSMVVCGVHQTLPMPLLCLKTAMRWMTSTL